MQYSTEYVVSTLHHQAERDYERDLERLRVAHERAEELRAAERATKRAGERLAPVKRMPFAGLARRLLSAFTPSARSARSLR